MKTLISVVIFIALQATLINNVAYAITPSQRAALNIWLQQQQNINPRPLEIINNINRNARKNNLTINHYTINENIIKISGKTKSKSNILRNKRILDTTFMFEKIKIKSTKKKGKFYYFQLELKKANLEKRGIYKKSKHIIFKSKTQVKYSVNKTIKNLKSIGSLTQLCPMTPLKIKPKYPGSRIKLIIFSYHMKFSGSFTKVKNALKLISNSNNYISMHNLALTAKKSHYELNVDLRFYHLGSRRNNSDKPFVYHTVKADKVCN